MLPPKKQQLKMISQFVSGTKWLEKYTCIGNSSAASLSSSSASKAVTAAAAVEKVEDVKQPEVEEEVRLNRKERLLKILVNRSNRFTFSSDSGYSFKLKSDKCYGISLTAFLWSSSTFYYDLSEMIF
jgi:hypothetical protein